MAVMMLIIILRQHETPMLPAACFPALLCPLLIWPFASPLDVASIDPLKLFLFGTMQFGLGLILLTIGGQMISATENALINSPETPLAVALLWPTKSVTRSAPGLYPQSGQIRSELSRSLFDLLNAPKAGGSNDPGSGLISGYHPYIPTHPHRAKINPASDSPSGTGKSSNAAAPRDGNS
jgi:hypothetical protein